jgi:ribosomal protein S1
VTISVTEQQLEPNSKSEFERLLEQSLSFKFEQGDIVSGGVVRIERDGILVDVGGRLRAAERSFQHAYRQN